MKVLRGIALLLILTGAGAQAQAGMQKLQVCVPDWREELLTFDILLARDRGFFKDAGLDVSVVAKEDHRGDIAGLLSREGSGCSVAATSVESMLIGETFTASIKPLYFYLYGADYDTNLIVSKKSGIKSVRDLKGKTVRLGQPATHIAMQNILKEAGMKMSDIKVATMLPSTEVLDKLESGEIAAAITYYPSMPAMLASGKVDVLKKDVLSHYVMAFVPHSFIGINEEFAKKNPEVLAKFKIAMDRVNDYANKHPAELVRTLARNYNHLGLKPWAVNDTLAEKSADLFGDLRFHGISDRVQATDRASSTAVFDSLIAYQGLLFDQGYAMAKADLSPWKQYLLAKQ